MASFGPGQDEEENEMDNLEATLPSLEATLPSLEATLPSLEDLEDEEAYHADQDY